MALPRNQGIFWEPGAYQTFINLALAISAFSHEFEKRRMRYFLVFGLTILTTFSTTGYIVYAAILLTYCLNEIVNSKSKKVLAKYLTLIVAVMLIFAVIYSCLPYDAQVQVFGKLKYYFMDKDKSASTSIRVNSVKIAVQNFLDHPIFGCGTSYFNVMQTDPTILLTCTPLNFFAYYGIFFGIIANLGLWMYAKSLVGNNLVSFALFCCFTLSTISQNFMRDPIFLTVIFLGIVKYKCQSKG